MNKGIKLWNKAKKIIPGGTQLLSKRSELHLPEQWPSYFKKAKGVEVIDLDGNKYIDMSYMGVGPYILGYADDDVNRKVKKVIDDSNASTLNSPEEVELAELLIKLHPWAGMVRYARTGGEAVAIAIRIARAHTKKDKIAFCGYHGWHDWYLSANLSNKNNLKGHLLPGLSPKGVPRALINTTIPFYYNKIEQLEKIISKNRIGIIVMEPSRHKEPENEFLKKVRNLANRNNIILIFDEVSSGFRRNIGGVHLLYDVIPDIAVFGKAMSNGYPMAAIIGKKKVMKAAEETFISSTYWTERIGPVAAIATIKKLKQKNVPAHIDLIGKKIGEGWRRLAKKHALNINVSGPNALINFSFNYSNAQEIKTYFVQEMLEQGYLASTIVYISYSHKFKHLKKYLESVDKVFYKIKIFLDEGSIRTKLKGSIAQKGFKRLT